ncbi:hypothetical protein ACVWZX_005312, partial [Deinococcus sp. UYEF24]
QRSGSLDHAPLALIEPSSRAYTHPAEFANRV